MIGDLQARLHNFRLGRPPAASGKIDNSYDLAAQDSVALTSLLAVLAFVLLE